MVVSELGRRSRCRVYGLEPPNLGADERISLRRSSNASKNRRRRGSSLLGGGVGFATHVGLTLLVLDHEGECLVVAGRIYDVLVGVQ